MAPDKDAGRDPLFVGATRPTMRWGVTYEAMIICASFSAIVFLGTGSLLGLAMYVPLHAICYLVCLKDPRFFRLFFLWVQTKCKSVAWRYWGAATSSPRVNTRKSKRLPE